MPDEAEREARKALARLRRSVEKATRELERTESLLREAESGDFPADIFEQASLHLHAVGEFIDEQAERLEMKLLQAGGLEPGRLRRPGGGAEEKGLR